MSDVSILIVDDEEELRENLHDLLEFKGYTVHAFSNAEDALAAFDGLSVDLALLDIQLPGIDGIELLRRLKEKRPEFPVAMVSASSVRGVLAQAMDYGAEKTILKPYATKDIFSTVDEMLEKIGKA